MEAEKKQPRTPPPWKGKKRGIVIILMIVYIVQYGVISSFDMKSMIKRMAGFSTTIQPEAAVGAFLLNKTDPALIEAETSNEHHRPPSSEEEASNLNEEKDYRMGGERNKESRDWFDVEKWRRSDLSMKSCFAMENICHSAQRFFYDERYSGKVLQPQWNLTLKASYSLRPGYPDFIAPQPHIWNKMQSACADHAYSPISNHMVLYSPYDGMLGEFYARMLPGLLKIMEEQQENITSSQSWKDQTQLYIHIDRRKNILDSHDLFLDIFSSNPLLSFKSLFEHTACRCIKRLFLCGYEFLDSEYGALLTPSGNMDWRSNSHRIHFGPNVWNHTQTTLRRGVIDHNPLMLEAIQNQRIRFLNRTLQTPLKDHHDWLIVGLAQRRGRRQFLNLGHVMKDCNLALESRNVICVQVNVEEVTSNSVTQAVVHGALDMLIGIHGAQMTEAIWMKDESIVLELLPYIPDSIEWGQWARWIHRPTPLGDIFHFTKLNHIGVALNRDSAPYCRGLNRTETTKCFQDQSWANRNYNVDPKLVRQAIKNFLLLERNQWTCASLQKHAMPHEEFVLYNVICFDDDINGEKQQRRPHQYFQSENTTLFLWGEKKRKFPINGT